MFGSHSSLAEKVSFCAGTTLVVLAEVWLIVAAMSFARCAAATSTGSPGDAVDRQAIAVHVTMCALLLGALFVLVTALSAGWEQVANLTFIGLLLLVTASRMVYTQP